MVLLRHGVELVFDRRSRHNDRVLHRIGSRINGSTWSAGALPEPLRRLARSSMETSMWVM